LRGKVIESERVLAQQKFDSEAETKFKKAAAEDSDTAVGKS
jgi:hypothetical protein